jgi:hypothetical protein
MPTPIVCLSAALRQYAEAFRGCFSQRQWQYFVTVLLGLVECEGRRTLSGLLAKVADPVSVCGLSRFFSRWSWSADEVAQTWQRRFRQQRQPFVQAEQARQRAARPRRRGRPTATVVTGYLILDDSVHAKSKGRKMQGLGWHYSGSEKRLVSGHSLFMGLYVLGERRCPLRPQLYRQQAVCAQEGVPFQSKIDLAVQQIEQFAPAEGTQAHVLIDSWYHCKRVRKAAQQRGWQITGGLKSNRKMRLIAADGRRSWCSLDEYAARLKPEDWQEAVWPSQSGGQKVYAHTVQTWIRKLGPTLLLITCPDPNAPAPSLRYWGSTLLEATAQTVIATLAVRWDIEVLFEDLKDLLGSDHYQLLSAEGLVRFWTLVACLSCFLDEQRAAQNTLHTWGDARRALQKEHAHNLVTWLAKQFSSGVTAQQVCTQWAL